MLTSKRLFLELHVRKLLSCANRPILEKFVCWLKEHKILKGKVGNTFELDLPKIKDEDLKDIIDFLGEPENNK